MKSILNIVLVICALAVAAQAQISNFKHVVVIVQEKPHAGQSLSGSVFSPLRLRQ
jgi:hypothetical protein